MTKKNQKKDKQSKTNQEIKELTDMERSTLANRIRVQLLTLDTDKSLDDMESIKRLKIMLNLFETNGVEFDTVLPLPQIDNRYLEVRLRKNKNLPSVVVVRNGKIPETAL